MTVAATSNQTGNSKLNKVGMIAVNQKTGAVLANILTII
jgi:hypothetical protein